MIHATLERIHREYGTTLLTVTHDINAALQRNTHVLALGSGKVIYAGETARFLENASSLLEMIYGIGFETVICSSTGDKFFIPAKEHQTS